VELMLFDIRPDFGHAHLALASHNFDRRHPKPTCLVVEAVGLIKHLLGRHTETIGDRIGSVQDGPVMSRRCDPIDPSHQAGGVHNALHGTPRMITTVRMGTERPHTGQASGRDRLPSSSLRAISHQNRQVGQPIGIRRSSVTSRDATVFFISSNSRNEVVATNQLHDVTSASTTVAW
jgi:hypothetical protein